MSIREHAAVISNAVGLGLRVLSERIVPPEPVRLPNDVPISADAVTTEWLTAVLCKSHRGACVEQFRVHGGSDGTSSRRALEVTYNRIGSEAGLPTKLFTKSATSFTSRLLLGLTGIGEGEAMYYARVRPGLNLRSPRSYHAAYDPRTCRSIVILDDLSQAGYRFPDPMKNRVTRRDADDMVEQMAIYHGALWNSERLTGELGSLRDTLRFQTDLNDRIGFRKRTLVGIERSGNVMPEAVYARGKEIWPALMRSLELNILGPQTLLHQDTHPGNWLRDPEGRMGLYDWQVVGRGGWALDYAYAISMALTTDDRRAWEEDLIKQYIGHLNANGVASPPSFDVAWKSYRQQMFHGLVFGLFTIGRGPLQPRMQPDEYSLQAIRRSTQAIDDLKSLDTFN